MERYQGKNIFCGIAIGKIYCYFGGEGLMKRTVVADTLQELRPYEQARQTAIAQLSEPCKKQ